jgi:uncharacterized protein YndB with AHSA1/START domain
MTEHVVELMEESIEIDASPEQVWAVVSDLPRLAEWSPQVVKSVPLGGPLKVGSRLFNINRRGLVVWPSRSEIVAYEPHAEVAFRVKENNAVWSFSLSPSADGGTTVVQRRVAPPELTPLSISFTKRFLGGQDTFGGELLQGMRATLLGIKAESER